MVVGILDILPTWLIALGVMGLIFVALEVGFRLSHRRPGLDEASALQASVLGLVALLLSFSFSMAEERFSQRRDLVVKEANAIGTLYLRSGFLPEPTRTEMRSRLRRYVDLRLEAYMAVGDRERFNQLRDEADQIQGKLWSALDAIVLQQPTGVQTLVTQALNDVIDVSADRLSAARNLIPDTIFVLLLVGVLGSGLLLGYQPETHSRAWICWTVFAVMLTAVMFTLLDLDLPDRGRIRTSQQPLVDLRRQMEALP
ncbi:DUF4239 domain-containing protein [Corallococcus sp. ZKHCc1 1396]|uniref:DUF4239 domain-containing protein n=1 Tax=Corallococcus soli TaxID=2710757 RepID=A0ABR9PPB2_9BACT|nr:DUF4239 domain-containing protein [Corallococcus soli]MBE4749751.1 DUF4239 domain-containing protein [Corallococcus soli]